ncbi:MAG: hypothetical protein ABH919_03440 [bacterium]
MNINEDTILGEIINNPAAKEILAKYNLPCLSCPFAEMEMGELKIGDVCRTYNIDIVKLLEDLKKI